jgi:hypothetical protein
MKVKTLSNRVYFREIPFGDIFSAAGRVYIRFKLSSGNSGASIDDGSVQYFDPQERVTHHKDAVLILNEPVGG